MPGFLTLLKLALLAFWTAWFAIVFVTNLAGALKAAGVLPPSWKLASKNYEAIAKAVSIYAAPAWVPRLLFAGVLVWQLLAALLFACAFAASWRVGSIETGLADLAFGCAILLWAAFMLADEITIKYSLEQPHELLFVAQIACLILMHVR